MVYSIKGDAMTTFELVKKWKAHDRYILKCQWSPDGKYDYDSACAYNLGC